MEIVLGLLCVVVLGQSAAITGLVWAVLRKQGVVAPILQPAKKSEPQIERKPAFYSGLHGSAARSMTVTGPAE
jgi:hypothetical protein